MMTDRVQELAETSISEKAEFEAGLPAWGIRMAESGNIHVIAHTCLMSTYGGARFEVAAL